MNQHVTPNDLRLLAQLMNDGYLPQTGAIVSVYFYPETRADAEDLATMMVHNPEFSRVTETNSGDYTSITAILGTELSVMVHIKRDKLAVNKPAGVRTVMKPDPALPLVPVKETVYTTTYPPLIPREGGSDDE